MNVIVLLVLLVTIVENKDISRLNVQTLINTRIKVVTRNKKASLKRNMYI